MTDEGAATWGCRNERVGGGQLDFLVFTAVFWKNRTWDATDPQGLQIQKTFIRTWSFVECRS